MLKIKNAVKNAALNSLTIRNITLNRLYNYLIATTNFHFDSIYDYNLQVWKLNLVSLKGKDYISLYIIKKTLSDGVVYKSLVLETLDFKQDKFRKSYYQSLNNMMNDFRKTVENWSYHIPISNTKQTSLFETN